MKAINTNLAPAAIGTYSQAIAHGEIVYLSGQIPLDPLSMQLCSEEISIQINQVFDNLKAVCEAAGGSLQQLAKLTVYLTDLNHFPLVNEAMMRYFTAPYPARVAIGVNALPRNAQIEIEGIMVLTPSK